MDVVLELMLCDFVVNGVWLLVWVLVVGFLLLIVVVSWLICC